ncbi:MAG TPA: STAS domain-containing protein [Pseudonocardia sp.]|uniref:STAS domain-containing protein n=1 Tax=Pseudonocardia sp. TaxID=60912 RepID=UPI002F3F0BF3
MSAIRPSRGPVLTVAFSQWSPASPDALCVRVSGELDLATVPMLIEEVAKVLTWGRHLVLDLSGVEFAGALTVAALIELTALAGERAGWLHVISGPATDLLQCRLQPSDLPPLYSGPSSVRARIAQLKETASSR